jgi:hypothetical protein
MSYITATDYQTITGFTLPASVSEGLANLYFASWSRDIEDYTGAVFELQPNTTKTFNLDYCFPRLLKIGGWQKDGLIVQATQNGTTTNLTEGVDFRFCNSFDGSCVVALDFECLGCFCRCDTITVTGTYGWSDGLPPNLQLLLIDSLSAIIATSNTGVNATGTNPVIYQWLKQERSRNMTRIREVDIQYINNASNLRNGYPIYCIECVEKLLYRYTLEIKDNVVPISGEGSCHNLVVSICC